VPADPVREHRVGEGDVPLVGDQLLDRRFEVLPVGLVAVVAEHFRPARRAEAHADVRDLVGQQLFEKQSAGVSALGKQAFLGLDRERDRSSLQILHEVRAELRPFLRVDRELEDQRVPVNGQPLELDVRGSDDCGPRSRQLGEEVVVGCDLVAQEGRRDCVELPH